MTRSRTAASLWRTGASPRERRGAAGPPGGGLWGRPREGPCVSPTRRGALPERWLSPPGAGRRGRLVEAAGGRLRLITLAPELPGAAGVLEQALRTGCVVAVGHSDAAYEEARDAFARGARHLTHAFNAMRPFHHREPGPLGAALDTEGVTVELIADGGHAPPAAGRVRRGAGGPQGPDRPRLRPRRGGAAFGPERGDDVGRRPSGARRLRRHTSNTL